MLEFDFGTANIEKIQASLETSGAPKARPLSVPAKLFRIVGCTLAIIVLSDIAGVVVTTVVDILASIARNFQGIAIMYAIWFALGVFTGFLIHVMAASLASGLQEGDWASRPGATRMGFLVCAVALPIMFGLAWFSVMISGDSDSVYVPGNTGLTVAYFIAMASGLIASQFFLYATQSKPSR